MQGNDTRLSFLASSDEHDQPLQHLVCDLARPHRCLPAMLGRRNQVAAPSSARASSRPKLLRCFTVTSWSAVQRWAGGAGGGSGGLPLLGRLAVHHRDAALHVAGGAGDATSQGAAPADGGGRAADACQARGGARPARKGRAASSSAGRAPSCRPSPASPCTRPQTSPSAGTRELSHRNVHSSASSAADRQTNRGGAAMEYKTNVHGTIT